MAGTSTRRGRHQKNTINCPNGTWATPVELGRLGWSGLLSRSVLRAPAGTASTAADIMVWEGGTTDDVDITDPSTEVPTEDRVFERTGIVVAGHATTADDDYDIMSQHLGSLPIRLPPRHRPSPPDIPNQYPTYSCRSARRASQPH